MSRQLYFGDNLQILRNSEYIASESVDLVYLDPPFNSEQDFNVLYEERDGTLSHSQMKAFEDSWHWTEEAQQSFEQFVEEGPHRISTAVSALRSFLGTSDMMAYLAMMAPRLVELHSKLKKTGSLYLHCDPSASHYLKMLLDASFGPEQFRNEIIWRRTGAHNNPRRYGPIHDTLLFYSKTNDYYYENMTHPYMLGHVEKRYKLHDGRFKFTSGGNVLTGSGATNGDSGKPWKGFDPSPKNRHWAIPGFLASQMPGSFARLGVLEKLDKLYEAGLIDIEEGNAWPTPVRYLDDIDGPTIQDIWAYQPYTEGTVYGTKKGIDSDVKWLGTTDPERVGYKTQKPIGLLTRIIQSSCPPGGVVLDPFCGCGTAVVSAEQQLDRPWIGIDVTAISIALVKDRLRGECKIVPPLAIGEPTCLTEARKLAEEDRYQFQWWVLGCLGAKKFDKKKGPDKAIDGRIKFHDEKGGPTKQIIVSVKSGERISVKDIRELCAVVVREKAQIGAFITLEEPTRDMKTEALEAGIYKSPWGTHRKIQILTVAEMLKGKTLDAPPYYVIDPTKKKAIGRAEFDALQRQRLII